jgi:uncharacterized surface protein with fasciclin (FAS1) repeats
MAKKLFFSAVAGALLATTACSQGEGGNDHGSAPNAQSGEARELAGDKTISAGLAADSRFLAAAKSAGLDQTLAGPGPYTVFAPSDAAFAGAPAGSLDAKPENRARLTGVLTYLILPGTVLAEDIGKAIDAGGGKAILATMGGGTLTATREGDKIVLTDASGNKATVTKADDRFSNGVVHHLDALLMPAEGAEAAAAPGQRVPG